MTGFTVDTNDGQLHDGRGDASGSVSAAHKGGKEDEDEDMDGDFSTRANEQTLSLALRKRRFKSRHTLAPESLFIG
jgi:hypothetical protein